MNTGNPTFRACLAAFVLAFAGGCAGLTPAATATQPSFYALDSVMAGTGTALHDATRNAPTLLVSPPRAAAGYDSQRILYVRQPHKLEYFAHSEWIDSPARMLAPLLVTALSRGDGFRVVVPAQGSASADLRLDTEVLVLRQEFEGTPSRVRFVLRAALVGDATRRIVASRDFETLVAAPSEDPYGGVQAANRAVQRVLAELSDFCAEAARLWKPGAN